MWRVKDNISTHLGDSFTTWKDCLFSCTFNKFGIEITKKHGKPEVAFKIEGNFTNVMQVHKDELWVGDDADVLVFNLA